MIFLVEGICTGIGAGNVKVDLWVGKCLGESNFSKRCYVGANDNLHALISETFYDIETIEIP